MNIDWAGVLLERETGISLNDYIHQNIVEPLGLKNTSLIPTEHMKKKLAYMHRRDHNGQLSQRDHLVRRAIFLETESDAKSYFNSGGAGCFSTPEDYCRTYTTWIFLLRFLFFVIPFTFSHY